VLVHVTFQDYRRLPLHVLLLDYRQVVYNLLLALRDALQSVFRRHEKFELCFPHRIDEYTYDGYPQQVDLQCSIKLRFLDDFGEDDDVVGPDEDG